MPMAGTGHEGNLLVRPARFEDFEAIMDIDRNVYSGIDFLPSCFHAYMRDPRVFHFVGEIDGKVVAYIGYFLDGPEEMVGIGARAYASLRGTGLYPKFNQEVRKQVLRLCPRVRLHTWASIDRDLYIDEQRMKREGYTLLERWHALFWKLSREVPATFVRQLDIPFPKAFAATQMADPMVEKLLVNPKNNKRLFPTGYFVAFYNWLPRRATAENLRELVSTHNVLVSMETPMQIAAVSFAAPFKVQEGTYFCVSYYHTKTDIGTLLDHMKGHTELALRSVPKTGVVYLSLRCQSDINISQVKGLLQRYLGKTFINNILHHESGVMAYRKLEVAKL